MTGAAARIAIVLAFPLVLGRGAEAETAPNPADAETQFRIAERLAAEGDASAAAAYQRVIAAAPTGPLADDAWVGLARMQRVPEWPEEAAGLDADRASAAGIALAKLLETVPGGDRAQEARYLQALLRLAPLPSRDVARARQDLIAVASSRADSSWSVRARYALGVIDEQRGESERAAGTFARIQVERPDSDVAPRAALGFARALLRSGRFPAAAEAVQGAIERGASPGAGAGALRGLALRGVLRAAVPSSRWSAITTPLSGMGTSRGAALFAAVPGGGLAVWDRKTSAAQTFDARGTASPAVPLEDATAIAADSRGRVYLGTRENLVVLDPRGARPVGPLGPFGSPAAMAVDASGIIWLADKKGERIGWMTPGGAAQVVRDAKGSGVSALAAAGGRLFAAEEKTGRIVVLGAGAGEAGFGTAVFRRPTSLAADAAGQVAVLDEKAETVTLLASDGSVRDTLPTTVAGIGHPLAVAFADDGTLLILDGSTGAVVSAP